MKKTIFTIICLITFTAPTFAEVQHVTVDQAVTIAIGHNLELTAKRKVIEELKQEIKRSNALKNPQFQSNFLMGKVTKGNSSQFGLALPVEVAKRSARKNVAKAELETAQNQVKEAEHDLKIAIMRAYFNVLYMKTVVNIYQEREKLFANMANITMNKAKNSDNDIDSLQANIKYKKQKIFLNKAKSDLLTAQFQLNNLMNLRTDTIMFDTMESSLFENDILILKINLPEYQKIEDVAMKYSYSIKIADNNIVRAQKELTQQRRQRIPDFTVAGGYAYQTAHQTGGEALPGAFVGVYTDIPLLYWYNPEVKQAKIKIEKNRLNKMSYESKLKIALKDNYNSFKYAKDNLSYYKSILTESEQILKEYTNKYQQGKVTLLNVMQVENAHKELLNEYITEMQRYYDAYLDLMDNVGHDILLEDEIFQN